MRKFSYIVLFLVGSAVSSLFAAAVDATAHLIIGKVESAPAGSTTFKPVQKGQLIPVGSTIRTGADGIAVLKTLPGAAIRVSPNSTISLDELQFVTGKKQQALVSVTEGTVSALIDKKVVETTDFKIKTPQGSAAARGTFYAVTVKKGKTYIGVQEGIVKANITQPPKAAKPKPQPGDRIRLDTEI